MPEMTPSSDPIVIPARNPWDLRLRDYLMRWLPRPERAPSYIVRLGLGGGAFEGLLLGLIQGGIGCAILSILWGAMVGLLFGIIAWKVRQRTHTLLLSLLAGVSVEALGGWLIAVYIPLLAWAPFWSVVGILLLIVIVGFPFIFLMGVLYHREIRAAWAGLPFGALIGMVGLTVVGVFITAPFGIWWAGLLGGLGGAIAGLFEGALVGMQVGALVGALVNVNRGTILPTYGGFAGAIGFGLAGWFTGGAIAGDGGEAMGVFLGVGYGALIGIKLGWLATRFRDCYQRLNVKKNRLRGI